MKRWKAAALLFVAAMIISSSMVFAFSGNPSGSRPSIKVGNVYVDYIGMNLNSTHSLLHVNGSPQLVDVHIYFEQNISGYLSYIYITTTQFKILYWVYHNGTFQEKFTPGNTNFYGSSLYHNASATPFSISDTPSSYISLRAEATVSEYSGPLSIHIVLSGVPGGVIY